MYSISRVINLNAVDSSQQEQTSITALPAEMLEHVLTFLGKKESTQLVSTSRLCEHSAISARKERIKQKLIQRRNILANTHSDFSKALKQKNLPLFSKTVSEIIVPLLNSNNNASHAQLFEACISFELEMRTMEAALSSLHLGSKVLDASLAKVKEASSIPLIQQIKEDTLMKAIETLHIPSQIALHENAFFIQIIDKNSISNRSLIYLAYAAHCLKKLISQYTFDPTNIENLTPLILDCARKGNLTLFFKYMFEFQPKDIFLHTNASLTLSKTMQKLDDQEMIKFIHAFKNLIHKFSGSNTSLLELETLVKPIFWMIFKKQTDELTLAFLKDLPDVLYPSLLNICVLDCASSVAITAVKGLSSSHKQAMFYAIICVSLIIMSQEGEANRLLESLDQEMAQVTRKHLFIGLMKSIDSKCSVSMKKRLALAAFKSSDSQFVSNSLINNLTKILESLDQKRKHKLFTDYIDRLNAQKEINEYQHKCQIKSIESNVSASLETLKERDIENTSLPVTLFEYFQEFKKQDAVDIMAAIAIEITDTHLRFSAVNDICEIYFKDKAFEKLFEIICVLTDEDQEYILSRLFQNVPAQEVCALEETYVHHSAFTLLACRKLLELNEYNQAMVRASKISNFEQKAKAFSEIFNKLILGNDKAQQAAFDIIHSLDPQLAASMRLKSAEYLMNTLNGLTLVWQQKRIDLIYQLIYDLPVIPNNFSGKLGMRCISFGVTRKNKRFLDYAWAILPKIQKRSTQGKIFTRLVKQKMKFNFEDGLKFLKENKTRFELDIDILMTIYKRYSNSNSSSRVKQMLEIALLIPNIDLQTRYLTEVCTLYKMQNNWKELYAVVKMIPDLQRAEEILRDSANLIDQASLKEWFGNLTKGIEVMEDKNMDVI